MINLPVQNFAYLQTINPLDNLISGLKSGLQTRYMSQEESENILNDHLKNAALQIKNQYAPDEEAAQLAMKKAMAPYYQAQTSNINQRTALAPIDTLVAATNASRLNNRFGNSYQLQKMLEGLSPAARATWISQNKEAYSQAINDVANQVSSPTSTNLDAMLQNALAKVLPATGIVTPRPGSAPVSLITPNQAINLQKSGIAKPGFSTNPDQANQIQLAEQMAANRGLTTPASLRQAESSVNFDNFLANNQQNYAQVLKSISPYAGLIGKGKLSLDALQSKNPQAYQDYQWFTNSFVPNIQNMVTQLEGSSVQKSKQQEIKNVFSSAVKSLTTDPESAIRYMNRTIDLLGEISKQRVNTAQPLFKDTFNKAYGFKGIPSPYVNNGNSDNDFVRVSSPDGKQRGRIPASRLNEFLKDHPEFRRAS